MKLPESVQAAIGKFNNLSLRERALVSAGVLAIVLLAWDSMLMKPLYLKQVMQTQELASLKQGFETMNALAGAQAGGPLATALADEQQLRAQLDKLNGELNVSSAGLVDPRRMSELLRDLLTRQHSLKLVSLKNLPVRSLVQKPAAPGVAAQESAPYVHPAEIIVEGSYLEVLAYLRAVEALPWRFYWRQLELRSGEYPNSRVRIELCTLSMDKEWLGV